MLDRTLIEKSVGALSRYGRMPAVLTMPIRNTDRAVGTMLSYEVSRQYGEEGLPDDSIHCTFRGSAGQMMEQTDAGD